VDDVVPRPSIGRQVIGARKLQAFDDGGLAGTVATKD